jgi:hypothetical protein
LSFALCAHGYGLFKQILVQLVVGSGKHKEKEMSVHILKKTERLQAKTFSGKKTRKNRSLKHKKGQSKMTLPTEEEKPKEMACERERDR